VTCSIRCVCESNATVDVCGVSLRWAVLYCFLSSVLHANAGSGEWLPMPHFNNRSLFFQSDVEPNPNWYLAYSSILKTEPAYFFEMSAEFYHTTGRHILREITFVVNESRSPGLSRTEPTATRVPATWTIPVLFRPACRKDTWLGRGVTLNGMEPPLQSERRVHIDPLYYAYANTSPPSPP
jgi:hypothetical protein